MNYYPVPERGLDLKLVNDAIEEVFAEHGRGDVQMPPKVYITLDTGDFRTMPAYVPALDMAGVKIVNVHPGNPGAGLPTVMALTVILDVKTGLPVAILNATGLTDMRTGAAGAVACKYLSPKKQVLLGLIGSGRQAQAQLLAISQVLHIDEVRVWSRDEGNAKAFCLRNPGFECRSLPIEKVCDCDVLVTTTPSRMPVVNNAWIHEATHINAIGADAHGKQELDPGILKRAKIFVDDPVQAVHSGEINVPITQGLLTLGEISGTLGDVVLKRNGRDRPDQITVFDSTGLAIQDLAIAKIAMKGGNAVPLQFP
jgi:alanine dehydrogenase